MKWLAAFFVAFLPQLSWPAELVFGTVQPYEAVERIQTVLTEAYRRIGYSIRFVELPLERSLSMVNLGEIDGEAMRVVPALSHQPNLVLVDYPVATEDFVAFGKGRVISTRSMESLRPFRLISVHGIRWLNRLDKGFDLTRVARAENAFRMVDAGRGDLVLLNRGAICIAVWQGMKRFEAQHPPLDKTEFYHYLNRKHADLREKVVASLKQMAEDGSTRRIEAEVAKKWASCPKADFQQQ